MGRGEQIFYLFDKSPGNKEGAVRGFWKGVAKDSSSDPTTFSWRGGERPDAPQSIQFSPVVTNVSKKGEEGRKSKAQKR